MSAKKAEVVQLAERCVVMVITVAKFRRPTNPKKCNRNRYHLWRWFGGPFAKAGLRCQCGLLEGVPGAEPAKWHKVRP